MDCLLLLTFYRQLINAVLTPCRAAERPRCFREESLKPNLVDVRQKGAAFRHDVRQEQEVVRLRNERAHELDVAGALRLAQLREALLLQDAPLVDAGLHED